jgi:hypothetical protein
MNILEKEIEDLLELCINDSDFNLKALKNRDYDFDFSTGKKLIKRQFELRGYGIIDLITISFEEFFDYQDNSLNIIPVIKIYELKKEKIDVNSLMQLSRYIKGMKRYIHKIDKNILSDLNKIKICNNIRGILVGKSVQMNGDFVFLMELIRGVKVITYKLDMNIGLKFVEENFAYTPQNESFEFSSDALCEIIWEMKNNFMESEEKKRHKKYLKNLKQNK